MCEQMLKLSKTSIGPDGIPPWIFRNFADFLSPVVTFLLNWSLRIGVFPHCLKFANVCPIPKCDKPKYPSDYRPISILPILSKIFERVIVNNFISPCIMNNIDKSQFAFIRRPGSGTTCALVSIQDQILRYLDKSSGAVRILAVDFSKAFDKLPHQVIVDACVSFNLSTNIITWICSFLQQRLQRVVCSNRFSNWIPVQSGVPQGSVVGPLLFILTVDDLNPVCENSTIVKYADDMVILHFMRSSQDDHLQNEWDHIQEWSSAVGLPINASKSSVMDIITRSNLITSNIYLHDLTFLCNVSTFKFLGVVFSSDLKWNKHVDYIIKKHRKEFSFYAIFGEVLVNQMSCICRTLHLSVAF